MAAPRKPSLYDLLQVRSNATTQDVRSAYRRLVSKHHPDRTEGADSEMLSELNSAYYVLADPDERARYDQQLLSGKPRKRVRSSRAVARTRRRILTVVLVTVSLVAAVTAVALLGGESRRPLPRADVKAGASAELTSPLADPASGR